MNLGPQLERLLCLSLRLCLCLSDEGFSGSTEGGCSCLPATGSEGKLLASAHFPPSHKSGAFTPETAEVRTFGYCVGRR